MFSLYNQSDSELRESRNSYLPPCYSSWGNWICLAWRRRSRFLFAVFKYLRSIVKKTKRAESQRCDVKRFKACLQIGANENLNGCEEKYFLNKRELLSLEIFQNLTEQIMSNSVWPWSYFCLTQKLDWVTSRHPFQTMFSYDSVSLWLPMSQRPLV